MLKLDMTVKDAKGKGVETFHLGKSKEHLYYVFPAPKTHKNMANRPTKYTIEKPTTTYGGRGTNGVAKLLPEVHAPANLLMSALLDYGNELGDYSILSAVIGNGWRQPDQFTQGVSYLDNVKMVMRNLGVKAQFPTDLVSTAEGMLGDPGDRRYEAFRLALGKADGWTQDMANNVLHDTLNYYVPRGAFNPHATGLVFDVNFHIFHHVYGENKHLYEAEDPVNALPPLNEAALRSACGMWLNQYSKLFDFDSYDTGREIWHMEYRKPKTP